MAMSPEQEALISRMFESYVTEHHRADIAQLAAAEDTHLPVVVNAMTLFEASMEVGDYFNAYPGEVLAVFDRVLQRTAAEMLGGGGQKPRFTLHARITGLPVCPELTRDTIPRARDNGHFLSVTGTVIRTSVAKVLEYERDYMCAKCRHVFALRADFAQFYSLAPPSSCPNPEPCTSFKFSCLSGGAEPTACRDYQEIKIQEQVQRLAVGSVPRSMVVVLEDDLVDTCKSGDEVTVLGVVRQRWRSFYEGAPCQVELVLHANNLEVNNQQGGAAALMEDVQKEFEEFWRQNRRDPMAGRNHILLSLCPQIFGMYLVKLAVAMVLAGGVQKIDPSGTRVRGECHLLLVGDPGTGKSQFLKYAAKISPRSVLTAGVGSTSAGLTVAAVKDGGEWHLEAGALVLADGGLCCIDEFSSIKEHDRISIHEAMEQQSISVAKAGMVCKLNTRTSILAATNPKGQYDPSEPLSVSVALASPLLSRFDLVLVLLDARSPEWDRVVSSFILEDRGPPSESPGPWSTEKMRSYFCLVRRLRPRTGRRASAVITSYYQLQRKNHLRSAARTTLRMLESLRRLAEAHAKLMFRETVTTEDAVMAVSVMECSMQGGGLLGGVNAVHTSFPDDPWQQYASQCRVLLERLNLQDLLQEELQRLAELRSPAPDPGSPAPDPGSPAPSPVATESGLGWFHSIAVSPGDEATPVVTSTQKDEGAEHLRGRSPRCMTSSSGGVALNPNRDTETVEDKEEDEDGECVVQKVSKSLRHRRISKLGGGAKGPGEEPGDKMAAEAGGGDMHSLLSGFKFQPKRMRTAERRPDGGAPGGGVASASGASSLPAHSAQVNATTLAKLSQFSFAATSEGAEPGLRRTENGKRRMASPEGRGGAAGAPSKRRNCFRLGGGASGLLAATTLFDLPESQDDVLDTDWDLETSK